MDRDLVSFVAIGVIAFVISGSEAVTCYECDSAISSNCLDPFSVSGVPTCIGTACEKAIASGSGVTVILRYCGHNPVEADQCDDVTTVKKKFCVCTGNLCNDGGMLKPMYAITVAVIIASIVALTWMIKI